MFGTPFSEGPMLSGIAPVAESRHKGHKIGGKLLVLSLLSLLCPTAGADSAAHHHFELSQEAYISEAFNGTVPDAQRVWVKGDLKRKVETILQHKATFLRVKYWQIGTKSVWILDEIGKDQMITTGISVIHQQGVSSIDDIKVLAYRESRGWEVKHTFFTNQFAGLHLIQHGSKTKLSKSIDGITGATLSVRALSKVAQIALLLDEHVRTAK